VPSAGFICDWEQRNHNFSKRVSAHCERLSLSWKWTSLAMPDLWETGVPLSAPYVLNNKIHHLVIFTEVESKGFRIVLYHMQFLGMSHDPERKLTNLLCWGKEQQDLELYSICLWECKQNKTVRVPRIHPAEFSIGEPILEKKGASCKGLITWALNSGFVLF